jgi:tetratricopeptide (TPR) repeat protein
MRPIIRLAAGLSLVFCLRLLALEPVPEPGVLFGADPAGLTSDPVFRSALDARLSGRYDEAFGLLSDRVLSGEAGLRGDFYLRLINSFEDKITDPRACEDFLAKAAASSELADMYLGSRQYVRGETVKLAEMRRRLGVVTNYLAVAPFPNEDGRGHETVFPPEEGLVFTDTYQGKVRPVVWRRIFVNPFGRLKADNFFRPYKESTGYFCVFLRSGADQSGLVKLAINTPFKLWINGSPARSDDAKHAFVIDQYSIPVALRSGWNVLLLKSSSPDQEEWKFLLRLSGFAFPVEQSVDPAVAGPGLAGAVDGGPFPDGGDPLKAGLEAATNAEDPAARQQARFEYAYYRYLLQDYDRNANLAGRLFQRLADAGSDPLYAFMAGASQNQYRLQKKYLERSLEISAGLVEPAVQLVNYYYNLGREQEMFRALASLAPERRPVPLSLFLAQYHLGRSDPLMALRILSAVGPRETSPYRSLKAAVDSALFAQGSAMTNLEKAFLLDRTDEQVRDLLVSRYASAGAVDRALALIDSVFELYPDSIELLEKKADLLAGLKRHDEALAELARAGAICPEDAFLLERTGDLWAAASVRSNSRRYYRASLAVKPNNNRLKEHAAALFPSTNVLTLYSKPIEEVWRRGADQAETVILLNQEVSEVYRDGTYSTLTHQVIRLNSEADLENFTEQNLFYSPDQERLDLLKARVYDRDMNYREIDDVSDYAYGGEDASLFYNLRYRRVAFPKLQKGAVVEIEYVRYNFSANELGADYFGTAFYLQDRWPVKLDLFTVIAEDGVRLYSGFENLAQPDRLAVTSGKWRNRTVTTWSATNMPKIEKELWAPAFGSLAASVVVSTMKDWKEFGIWLTGLYKDQLVADEAVRETVLAVTEGSTTLQEKVRRIWEFCASQVRYVGLELGIGGIRPRPVGTTLASGFGDCKDKASLLSVMLAEIGVKSGIALVRTTGKGTSTYGVPYVGAFDHAVCWVNDASGGTLLDGTADLYTYGVVPCQDEVGRVLLLDGGQTRFVKVPQAGSDRNRNTIRSTVAIAADGSALLKRSVAKTGNLSPRFRYDFYAADKRREKLEEYWSQWFQGSTVDEVRFAGLDDLSVEPTGSYEVAIPGFTEDQNGRTYFKAGVGRSDYVLQYAADARPRRYDLELPFPFATDDETVFVLPAGTGLERAPLPVKEENDFVAVERSVKTEAGSLTVRLTIVFKTRFVPRARYPEFRAMMNRLNVLQDEKIFFHKVP